LNVGHAMSNKTLHFYERIVALQPQTHRNMRMKLSPTGLGFARDTHSVLLAASELGMAALDYPCVFVPTPEGSALIALVGLRENENLMVDAQGAWAEHRYVPAYIRRYPFVLAEQTGSPDMTVCFDEAYEGCNEVEGEALFDAEGKPGSYLQNVQNLLVGYHRDLQVSAQWVKEIEALDLLVDRSIGHEHKGQRTVLQGFKVVDEAKLLALPPDTVQRLFTSGALGWIYAHMLSMNNVNKLGARLNARLEAAPAA
jgi:hypothetical protein